MTEIMAVRTRQNVQRCALHCNRNTSRLGRSAAISLCKYQVRGFSRRSRFALRLIAFHLLSLGGVLETLRGFKIGWYVDVGNEMHRLMFTLAHASPAR
jgi:hypothetical protein